MRLLMLSRRDLLKTGGVDRGFTSDAALPRWTWAQTLSPAVTPANRRS